MAAVRIRRICPLKTENLLQAESSVPTGREPSQETGEAEILQEGDGIMPEIQQMTGSVPEGGHTRPTVTGPTAGWRQGNPPPITSPIPDWQQNTRPAMTGPIPGWWAGAAVRPGRCPHRRCQRVLCQRGRCPQRQPKRYSRVCVPLDQCPTAPHVCRILTHGSDS